MQELICVDYYVVKLGNVISRSSPGGWGLREEWLQARLS